MRGCYEDTEIIGRLMRLFCIVVLEQEFLWSSVGLRLGRRPCCVCRRYYTHSSVVFSSLGAGLSVGMVVARIFISFSNLSLSPWRA